MKNQLPTYFVSSFLAYLGGAIFNYTLIIFSKNLYGTEKSSGMIFLILHVPLILLNILPGIIADRMSKKRILFISQSVYIIVSFAIGYLAYFGIMDAQNKYVLYSLTFFCGLAFAFMPTTRMAALNHYVSDKGNLSKATILMNILFIIGLGSGPPIAGILKKIYSWEVLFFLIGFIFILSNFFLVALENKFVRSKENQSLAKTVQDTFSYIQKNITVSQILFFSAFAIILLGPFQVLLPHFAKSILGLDEKERGLFMITFALSLLIGGIITIRIRNNSRVGLLILFFTISAAIFCLLFSLQSNIFCSILLIGLSGVSGSIAINLLTGELQNNISDIFRARIMSLMAVIQLGAAAISGLVSGHLSDIFGISGSFLLISLFLLISTFILGSRFSSLRKIDTKNQTRSI